MRNHYVLIDYENVQPESLAGLEAGNFRVLLFVGANQAKLPFETAAAMQKLGCRAEYLKAAGSGPNALDFHIVYHLGRQSALDAAGCFWIVSKDTGFDPLIRHLKDRGLTAARVSTIAAVLPNKIFEPKPAKVQQQPAKVQATADPPRTLAERVDVVVADLRRRNGSKPKSIKTLTSTVAAIFRQRLTDKELAGLLTELRRRGLVKIGEDKVTYALGNALK